MLIWRRFGDGDFIEHGWHGLNGCLTANTIRDNPFNPINPCSNYYWLPKGIFVAFSCYMKMFFVGRCVIRIFYVYLQNK